MANFADLWEQEPTNKFGGLNEDMSSRLQAANEAWKAKTGRDLPITSGARSPEQGIKLFGERASNPNLVAKPGTSLHEKGMAADISSEVPNAFLDQFGLHRPFGSRDPIHVEINPKSSYAPKSASVTVSGAPAPTNFADLWDSTPAAAETSVEKGQPKGFTQIAKAAQETTKPIADVGKGLASIADIALGAVPAVVGGATYAGGRAFGQTPEQAQALAQKVSAPLESPIGKALGITEDPAYKQEAVRRAMDSIGQYIGESAETISKKTGIPKFDVENMINTLSFAAGEGVAATKGARAKLGAQFEKAFPLMEETPKPSMAGVGAAATENATILKQAIDTASPELRTYLETLKPEEINTKALNAHLEADSLPVPVRLTKGQALEDEVLISKERNERGFKEENARRLNEQNKALQESANAMKERVAPDVFSTDFVADAESTIENVSKKAKQFETDIKTAYDDLDKQGAGKIEVDSKTFSNNARNGLMEKDDLEFLPSVIAKRLDSYAKGKPMNFNQYENLRTQIARETRKAQRADDGNAVHALTLVRGELEKLPLLNETAEAKAFADKARGLAKQEFDLLDKNKDTYNPFYADVVNGVADTKDFIPKTILRSKNQDFAKTMSFIADDPQTIQHLRNGTLDWIIRDSTDASGNFKTAKFAKHIENLDVNKKLTPLFGEEAETLRKIARTGQRVEARPTGSFVNESGSTTALGGLAKEYGQGLIESIPYVGAPIRATKEIVGGIKKRKEISESLKPGAGIKLKDIGKE
jgi:hypothetical protein